MATAGRYIMAIADRYIIVTAGRDIIAAPRAAWWAQVESNHRPRAYQARALTY